MKWDVVHYQANVYLYTNNGTFDIFPRPQIFRIGKKEEPRNNKKKKRK